MNNKKIQTFKEFTELKESNYPAGAEHDSRAPWNQPDPEILTNYGKSSGSRSGIKFSLVDSDLKEFALFEDDKTPKNLYIGYIDSMDDLEEYRPYTQEYIGKDEDGDPEFETEYLEIDGEGLEAYVNNLLSREIGEGLEDWETGEFPVVKLDADLATVLKSDFSKFSTDPKYTGSMNPRIAEEQKKLYKRMITSIDSLFPEKM